jgi:hypothetical protein
MAADPVVALNRGAGSDRLAAQFPRTLIPWAVTMDAATKCESFPF